MKKKKVVEKKTHSLLSILPSTFLLPLFLHYTISVANGCYSYQKKIFFFSFIDTILLSLSYYIVFNSDILAKKLDNTRSFLLLFNFTPLYA